jgi:hypothetical protein
MQVLHKLFNWLVKCTLKHDRSSVLRAEYAKTLRNEIFHDQCTTHNAVIPFYNWTDRFKSEISR